MGNDVPRRLKRFYRNGGSPPGQENDIDLGEVPLEGNPEEKEGGNDGEIAKALALDEVARFKEEHKRLPKKEEYDQIAESIFAQLKDKEQREKAVERLERKGRKPASRIEGTGAGERQGTQAGAGPAAAGTGGKGVDARAERLRQHALKHGRPVPAVAVPNGKNDSPEPVAGGRPTVESELSGLSVEDLFLGEKKQGKEKGGLGELEGTGEEGEFSLEGLEGMEEGKQAQQDKCPKCGSPAQEIFFCPECGTAFCEKCSKKAEAIGNARVFVCPGCGKKIKK